MITIGSPAAPAPSGAGSVRGNGALSPAGFDARDPSVQGASWHPFGERGARYTADLKQRFPDIAGGSGRFDISYHDAMSATLDALTSVSGDLSGTGTRFRSALAAVTVHSPGQAWKLVAMVRNRGS